MFSSRRIAQSPAVQKSLGILTAEFLRLVSVLKGKGVDAGRWERTAREYGRRERARIAEALASVLKPVR